MTTAWVKSQGPVKNQLDSTAVWLLHSIKVILANQPVREWVSERENN